MYYWYEFSLLYCTSDLHKTGNGFVRFASKFELFVQLCEFSKVTSDQIKWYKQYMQIDLDWVKQKKNALFPVRTLKLTNDEPGQMGDHFGIVCVPKLSK